MEKESTKEYLFDDQKTHNIYNLTMDYEKEYKKLKADISKAYLYAQTDSIKGVLESILPELKESKDDRIRKAIICYMTYYSDGRDQIHANGVTRNEAIAWLKKQDEKNLIDSVEPKFHRGQWIAGERLNTVLIVNIDGDRYEVEFLDGSKGFPHIDYVDRLFHPWTIQDAKDGDVLADKYNNIGILQECECVCWNSYIYLGCDGELRGSNIGGRHEQTDTHPATKEQRNLLFQKIKEAGYEWDVEKKVLKELGIFYCNEHCKVYRDTGGKCFFGFDCPSRREAEQKLVHQEVTKIND